MPMPPLRERTPPRDRSLRIIVAGSHQPSKRQGIVLEGASLLLHQRPHLTDRFVISFYGNTQFCPGFYGDLRKKAEREQVQDLLRLHGSIPQSELWQRFSQSDLLHFPA